MEKAGTMAQMKFSGAIVICCAAACFGVAEEVAARPAVPQGSSQRKAPLEVQIDKSRVDLEKHRLALRLSRPAGHVRLKVTDAEGKLIAEDEIDFDGEPAGQWLVVRWKPRNSRPVARIEVYAYDTEGYYKGVALVPWSLEIPHEEVHFETNSAEILPEEVPKLEASRERIQAAFEKHKELGNVTLFIAGHTDTRGSAQHNRTLSLRRARSIARWFRNNGMTIPIAYEGFGERVPEVKTKDEVDEPRNRRVDYVLAVEPPRLKSTGAPAAWKRLGR